MLNSRDTKLLHWKVQELLSQLIINCKKFGVEFKIIGTVRDQEYQSYIYEQGRSRKGNIVTNAKYTSFHRNDVGLAFDLCPLVHGKLDWNAKKEYAIIIREAKLLGFTAGADWVSFPESAHFQLDGGLKSSDILAGKRPSWFYEKPNTQQQSPLQLLKSKCIISDIDYWDKSLKTQKYIQSQNVKALITNFYRYLSGIDDFIEAINYLNSKKVITNKNYWLDVCARNQDVESEYVKLIVERMAKLIK